MDEELLKNILRILEELPDENCCIEYKEMVLYRIISLFNIYELFNKLSNSII